MATTEQRTCPLDEIAWPSGELAECPFPYYERLREEAPVYKYPGREQYLLSRWEDVVYVAEHPEIFIQDSSATGRHPTDPIPNPDNEPLTSESMAITNPPEHRRKRSLGLGFVSTERLKSYEPLIVELADDLIDQVIDRGHMEFYSEFANKLPVRLVAEVLGLPREDTDMFVKWYESSAPAANLFLPEEERLAQNKLKEEAVAYMAAAVRDRYENPRDDYLTEFIRMQIARDGEPALTWVTQEADLLLFAGNLTTTHMLASMMNLMLGSPADHARLVNDPSMVKDFVEETLRLESPVQWLQRYVNEAVTIGGIQIPQGASVAVMWASGNRDPDRWGDDADALDLDRKGVAKHHLAFGRGNHRCLGAPLARLEGRLAFQRVLERMKNIRLAPGHETPRHLENILFRAPKEVFIEFDAA
jgi:cytochrome P450